MKPLNPLLSFLEPVMAAALVAMTLASFVAMILSIVSPCPLHFAGVTVDRLSTMFSVLVAAVGTVNFQFSRRYLRGEPGQARFLRWLFATVVGAYVLMLSTHLVLLFGAWSLVSLGLHKLLTFYADRPMAQLAARQKFLISRLGDVCLLSAIGLAWHHWRSFDLGFILNHPSDGSTSSSVALLIVVAALAKSAQFPFHSWLPETMEAPTPVSALMHAGVINAGGALLIRFAPLIELSRAAMLALSIVGTMTMVLGSISMWAQVKAKRTLAWSTVAQMGFMMVQCGLGAFPVAALHIVGHGCYKAWSFLWAAEVPTTSPVRLVSPIKALGLVAAGTIAAIACFPLAARLAGGNPFAVPGELALALVLAMSIGQLWRQLLSSATIPRVLAAILLAPVVSTLGFGGYRLAGLYLEPIVGGPQVHADLLAWVTAMIPVLGILLLTVIHAFGPTLHRSPRGRAFQIHALHGFYGGALADRIVESLWNPYHNKEQAHG